MYLDHDNWGRDESSFVVSFERDRYIGPTDADLAPLFIEENYVFETRFIRVQWESVTDTDAFEDAAIFPSQHEAALAVQWHRKERGDHGQLYNIRPL